MRQFILPNNTTHRFKTGFTLVEILLVMLLISILVLGINAAYRQAHAFWSRITATQPIYSQSRTVLDTLRQELSFLYLPKATQNEEGQEPAAFFSVKAGFEISFLTLNPAWNANTVISKPAKVIYTFNESSEGTGTLTRSEQLFSGEKATGGNTQSQVILTGLGSFEIRVLARDSDDGSWKDSLECKEKPPQAIEIQLLWPEEKYCDEIVFKTIVPISCSNILSIDE